MLSTLLVHFLLRLSFGLTAAMFVTSFGPVTAGFFRVHLWVAMGLNTLAALALSGNGSSASFVPWTVPLVITAAVVSYVGSVIWLYERSAWGRWFLLLVCVFDGLAAYQITIGNVAVGIEPHDWRVAANVLLGGLLLGFALASMLLGHWYLNTPSMQLTPLRRLLVALLVIALLRGLFDMLSIFSVATTVVSSAAHGATMPSSFWTVVSLRWLSGIVGTILLTTMSWLTLRIPNTQSATGILYVVVVFVFLGELSSFWLAANYGSLV